MRECPKAIDTSKVKAKRLNCLHRLIFDSLRTFTRVPGIDEAIGMSPDIPVPRRLLRVPDLPGRVNDFTKGYMDTPF